jgi:hypothetical protein
MGFNQWRMRRLADGNEAECGLRVVSGEHPGLTKKWTHGVAALAKGQIDFRPFLPPGIRVRRPFTPPVVVRVLSLEDKGREPGLVESWSVSSASRVLTLRTGDASLEWAVRVEQLDWARSRLEGGPVPS